jgi:hypothetical protein
MRHFAALLASLLLGASSASAQYIDFDFSGLGFFDHDAAVGSYMTDVYGSAISTSGVVSSNDRSDVGLGQQNFFIATSFQFYNRGDFEILFEETPIIGAEFEGHIIDATVGDDFRFWAFSGDEEVYHFSRNDGESIFDSGWLAFDQPVDRIVISDSGRKDVGMDDLRVQVVPAPATGLLLLCGSGPLLRRRTHRLPRQR